MIARILTKSSELTSLAAVWERALPPTPFASYALSQAWFGETPGARPFVIAVYNDEHQVVAIAPWAIVPDALGTRRITGVWHQDAWYHDLVWAAPASAVAVAEAIANALRRRSSEWDWIGVNLRPGESAKLIAALGALGRVRVEPLRYKRHQIMDLSAGFERYLESRGASFQREYAQKARRLEKTPHCFVHANAQTLDAMLEAVEHLYAARERTAGDWSSYMAMVAIQAREALKRDALFFYGLQIEGRWAALDMAIRCGQRSFGVLKVFDPQFSKHSPGRVLAMHSLRAQIDAGVGEVDMGPGLHEWKTHFANGQLETVEVRLASRRSLAGKALVTWRGAIMPRLKRSKALRALYERLTARPGPVAPQPA